MVMAVAVAAALVGAACSVGGDVASKDSRSQNGTTTTSATPTSPSETRATPIGTHEVIHTTLVLVDPSRRTRAHGGQPELPERSIPLDVWYPRTDQPDGGLPLIVFSHGSTRLAAHYEATLRTWASAGYVVVGPNFPLSKEGTPGGTDYGDIAQQAADVSFVINQVVDSADDSQRPWAALVDPQRIGLGGQSFGAITTVATAINPCCADERVGAITEFAGAWADLGSAGPIGAADAPPALLVHGDADPTVPYSAGTSLLASYPGEVRLLTLIGSGHDPGFFGGLDEPLDELVTRATVAFYDQQLKADPDAASRLEALVAAAGPTVATLTD